MALNLFKEILPSITTTKQRLFVDGVDEKDYSPYMVNHALSLYNDMLFQANQMNMMAHLPKMAQYDYLMGTVRGRKRSFVRWPKKLNDENLQLVMTHFNYSADKATMALKLMTEEQLEHLQKIYEHIA